jgi:hypothetical protein
MPDRKIEENGRKADPNSSAKLLMEAASIAKTFQLAADVSKEFHAWAVEAFLCVQIVLSITLRNVPASK